MRRAREEQMKNLNLRSSVNLPQVVNRPGSLPSNRMKVIPKEQLNFVSKEEEEENFFSKNKSWLIPVGVGILGLIVFSQVRK